MGVTNFSLDLLTPIIEEHEIKTVCELGAQNLYTAEHPLGSYASMWYEERGIKYMCLDLNGENGAYRYDLSQPLPSLGPVDLLTDFGTSEHVGPGRFEWWAICNCWRNKHNLVRVGGIMVSENPLTGNWPGHGFNYYSEEFYHQLAEAMGYEIIKLGTNAAMGNVTDGWNVHCVLRKMDDRPFLKMGQFKNLDLRQV